MAKNRFSGLGFLLFVTCVACSDSVQLKTVEADLVIANVNVIVMNDDSVDKNQSVFIRDGIVVEIGPSPNYSLAVATKVVDGNGKFLIPGLSDMHVHIWAESELPLYVANGVTLVRNMWGEPPTLQLRNRVESGAVTGPRIVTAGRLVDGDPPVWGEFSGVATSTEEARSLMDEQRDSGFDFFKIYAQLSLETFDGIAAHSRTTGFPFAGHIPGAVPLDHALSSGISTIEHLSGWTNAARHADSPYQTRQQQSDSALRWENNTKVAEKLAAGKLTLSDLFDLDEARRLAELAAANGVWNVPTLAVNKRLVTSSRQAEVEFARPEMRYMSPETVASWDPSSDFRLKNYTDNQLEASQVFFQWDLALVKILHEAGAPLLAGTDAPNPFVVHGYAIHEELEYMVDAGFEPYEALVAATRAPAEFLGELESSGTIAVGKSADLVLLNANPLRDITATRKIAGVALSGTWHSNADLQELLEGIAASFETPDDWFDGVEPLQGDSTVTVYDRTFDDTASGAARAMVTADGNGSKTLRIQSRWRDGSEIKTGIYDIKFDGQSGISSFDYAVRGDGPTPGATVRTVGGTVTLLAELGDGTKTSQELVLPPDGLLLIANEASMALLAPRLDALSLGGVMHMDVVLLDTFGMRLVEEQWTITRNEDNSGAKTFSGAILRGSTESAVALSYDGKGIVSFAITNQFGTAMSLRRE